MRHTRDYWTGRPVSYFALHRKGFFMPSRSRATRWALTPPFHPYPDRARLAASRTGRYILCDTIRHYALKRSARTWLPSCGILPDGVRTFLSKLWPARHYPRLGIKELGATVRPQN
jgi:hypothetical protein